MLKLSELIVEGDIQLARILFEACMAIDEPEPRFKALLDLYKFIEAPAKARDADDMEAEPEDAPASAPADVLKIVSK